MQANDQDNGPKNDIYHVIFMMTQSFWRLA